MIVRAEALADLLDRLCSSGFPQYQRAVRLGVRQGIPCRITVADGYVDVRLAADRREGPEGSIVAEVLVVTVDDSVRTFIKASADRKAGDRYPRRSVRVSDEKWIALARYGAPSTVTQDAIDEYLERRKAR